MFESRDLGERHVIPRWLPIKQAIESGMFARPGLTRGTLNDDSLRAENESFLEAQLNVNRRAWHRTHDIVDAVELLSTGIVMSRMDRDIYDASKKILEDDTSVLSIKLIAQKVIDKDNLERLNNTNLSPDHYIEIRRRKHLIDLNPRDALLITETALCYANLGQLGKSEKFLRRAMALAPNSRYVVRSAARFFCHSERPDEALRIIRLTPRHQTDPWLKAAELAVAGMIGGKITNWRKSQHLVDNDSLSLRDRSELASEMATLELQAGARKAAIKKLKLASTDPTENAAAQVEFLGRKVGFSESEEINLNISKSFEANAVKCYWEGNLIDAFAFCLKWQEIEPFSAGPAILGSFLCTTKSNSLDAGFQLASRALLANPNDANLLNNLAVISAYKGDLENARQYSIRARTASDNKSIVANRATEGLIYLRSGDLDRGIEAYNQSMEMAVKDKNINLLLRAYAFFAREMCRIDNDLRQVFCDELTKVELSLKQRKMALPRDVSIIREELFSVGPILNKKSSSIAYFRNELLEKALDSRWND